MEQQIKEIDQHDINNLDIYKIRLLHYITAPQYKYLKSIKQEAIKAEIGRLDVIIDTLKQTTHMDPEFREEVVWWGDFKKEPGYVNVFPNYFVASKILEIHPKLITLNCEKKYISLGPILSKFATNNMHRPKASYKWRFMYRKDVENADGEKLLSFDSSAKTFKFR